MLTIIEEKVEHFSGVCGQSNSQVTSSFYPFLQCPSPPAELRSGAMLSGRLWGTRHPPAASAGKQGCSLPPSLASPHPYKEGLRTTPQKREAAQTPDVFAVTMRKPRCFPFPR